MNKPETSPSNISRRKTAVRSILDDRNAKKLNQWAEKARNPHRILTSFIFDNDPLICFRAAEAIGITAILSARENMESVRRIIRRFFWMMNDESGNFCCYAPYAIGEIVRNVPKLIAEYGHLLPPFLVEEPFEKGTRLAIARIAEIDKTCFSPTVTKKLIQTLDDNSPDIRGSSIIALKALNASDADDKISSLVDDNTQIELYDFNTGKLTRITVGEAAKSFSE
ncbi:MAG: hypothetical protein J7K40_07545 [candidate division Zixibacteria bacterium]|nr:hypothetical protein [candidate division Zixibacteria bacterium]